MTEMFALTREDVDRLKAILNAFESGEYKTTTAQRRPLPNRQWHKGGYLDPSKFTHPTKAEHSTLTVHDVTTTGITATGEEITVWNPMLLPAVASSTDFVMASKHTSGKWMLDFNLASSCGSPIN